MRAVLAEQYGSAVLASAATGFVEFATSQGLDALPILDSVGISVNDVGVPTKAIGLHNYCTMLEYAAQRTDSGHFGLSYGIGFSPQMLGLIGYIAIASTTLEESINNFIRLFPYHQQGTRTDVRRSGRRIAMDYNIVDRSIVDRRQDAEFTIAVYANVVRTCLGSEWMPEAIHFEHAAPADAREQHRLFDCEILYGQPTNSLILHSDCLQRAMPDADATLLAILKTSLMSIGATSAADDLMARICQEVREQLPDQDCSLDRVAHALQMPKWTLQRRLAERGLTFSALREEVRRDLAITYVRDSVIPLIEVASLVGYGEQSAFSRAFRSWFDASPARIRRRHQRSA